MPCNCQQLSPKDPHRMCSLSVLWFADSSVEETVSNCLPNDCIELYHIHRQHAQPLPFVTIGGRRAKHLSHFADRPISTLHRHGYHHDSRDFWSSLVVSICRSSVQSPKLRKTRSVVDSWWCAPEKENKLQIVPDRCHVDSWYREVSKDQQSGSRDTLSSFQEIFSCFLPSRVLESHLFPWLFWYGRRTRVKRPLSNLDTTIGIPAMTFWQYLPNNVNIFFWICCPRSLLVRCSTWSLWDWEC